MRHLVFPILGTVDWMSIVGLVVQLIMAILGGKLGGAMVSRKMQPPT